MRRSRRSTASSMSTMATGLKAARRSSKICAGIWRSSAGLPLPLHVRLWPQARLPTGLPFPPEADFVTDGAALAVQDTPAQAARSRRLLIFTDAWAPQVNGVVRTLETLGRDLESLGFVVRYAT